MYERSTVSDLINFNYEYATRALPRIMVFGNNLEIYNATINIFNCWSYMMQDLVYPERAKDWLKLEEQVRVESLRGTANIAQQMMMYIQSRLIYLSQWIREKKYKNIEVFHNDIKDEKIVGPLMSEFKLFYDEWKKWMDSKGLEKMRISLEFQKWMEGVQENLPDLK